MSEYTRGIRSDDAERLLRVAMRWGAEVFGGKGNRSDVDFLRDLASRLPCVDIPDPEALRRQHDELLAACKLAKTDLFFCARVAGRTGVNYERALDAVTEAIRKAEESRT